MLLKYMFNDMTGGVTFSKVNFEDTGLLTLVMSKVVELGCLSAASRPRRRRVA